MNRRGFIATLTAIAGVALAKIKAPAAPRLTATAVQVAEANALPGTGHLVVYGTGTFKPQPLTGMVEMSGKHYYFTKDAVYVCDSNGLYRLSDDERCIDKPWPLPVNSQQSVTYSQP